jgi:uncharacterized protein (DUF486 family)
MYFHIALIVTGLVTDKNHRVCHVVKIFVGLSHHIVLFNVFMYFLHYFYDLCCVSCGFWIVIEVSVGIFAIKEKHYSPQNILGHIYPSRQQKHMGVGYG